MFLDFSSFPLQLLLEYLENSQPIAIFSYKCSFILQLPVKKIPSLKQNEIFREYWCHGGGATSHFLCLKEWILFFFTDRPLQLLARRDKFIWAFTPTPQSIARWLKPQLSLNQGERLLWVQAVELGSTRRAQDVTFNEAKNCNDCPTFLKSFQSNDPNICARYF